jgi:hypothetical protein
MTQFFFGVAALVVNVAGYIPYFAGIFSGRVKPQRITWGIWSILTTIAFVNQVANHGGYSSLFFGSTVLLVVTVFILSIKRGLGGSSGFDKGILIAAAVLFLVWIITRDTRISTILAVTIDGIGALPTLKKAYLRPDTEVYAQWVLAAISGVLSTLAVPKPDYILYVYPLYVVVMNAAIVAAKFTAEHQSHDKKLRRASEKN